MRAGHAALHGAGGEPPGRDAGRGGRRHRRYARRAPRARRRQPGAVVGLSAPGADGVPSMRRPIGAAKACRRDPGGGVAAVGRPASTKAIEAIDDALEPPEAGWEGEAHWDEETRIFRIGSKRSAVAGAAARPADCRRSAAAPRPDLPAMRPLTLPGPRNGVPDNLQRIRGIGQKNEELLNSLGIYHFGQIAAWTPAEARWVASHLAFPERIERDDWVGQAIILATRRRHRLRQGRGAPKERRRRAAGHCRRVIAGGKSGRFAGLRRRVEIEARGGRAGSPHRPEGPGPRSPMTKAEMRWRIALSDQERRVALAGDA